MDISRSSNHVELIKNFWLESNCDSVCRHVDYTRGDKVLDHIVVLEHQKQLVKNIKAIHTIENPSDHEPVHAEVDIPKRDMEEIAEETEDIFNISRKKFEWEKADMEKKNRYKDKINELIAVKHKEAKIFAGHILLCQDTHCKSAKCREEIDTL